MQNVYTKRTPNDSMYDTIILLGERGEMYTKKIYEFSKYCLVLFLDEYIKGCGFFKFMT